MQKDERLYQILIIEDNPGDLLLVQDYLEEEIVNPTVFQAASFAEGCKVLQENHNEIDLVLLDLSLPDKQGEDLLNDMLRIADDLPVIILTGYSDISFAMKSLAMGACDYLLKDNLNPTVLYKSVLYSLERNKYLLELKESEQRYSDLFHLSPQPMWVYDLETLYFLDVNKAATRHYGYTEDEFLKMTIKDIRPEYEISKLQEAVALSFGKEQLDFQGEFVHKKKNGDEIVVDVRSNIIHYQGRKAEVVLSTDITERHKHLKAIQEQNKKLKEIAWTQSHVVRAPLARIMGLITAFDDQTITNEERGQIQKYIMESANDLDMIIRKIVSTSQKIDVSEL